MGEVRDLFWNVLASAVWFTLGFAVRWLYVIARARRADPFWRTVLTRDSCLVLGRFQGHAGIDPTGLMGAGDVRALHELVKILARAGLARPRIEYADSLSPTTYDGDLVLFGGSDTNRMSELTIRVSGSGVSFDLHNWPSIVDEREGTVYRPKQEGDVFRNDYGILICGPNPSSSTKRAVVVAGCSGYGTWAGIRLTQTAAFRREILGQRNFVCLFAVDIVDEFPAHISMVLFRPLAGPPSGP